MTAPEKMTPKADPKPSFDELLAELGRTCDSRLRDLESRLHRILEEYQGVRPICGPSPLLDDVVTTVTARDQIAHDA